LNVSIRDSNAGVWLHVTLAEEHAPIEVHILVSSPECRTELYRNKSFGKIAKCERLRMTVAILMRK